MGVIKHNLNLLIIPFVYEADNGYEECIKEINQQHSHIQSGVWQPLKLNHDDRFFEHIHTLIPDDDTAYESTIGKRWKLNSQARKLFGLPINDSHTIVFNPKKGNEIRLKVKDVIVYLFETKIGFLLYEIEYPHIKTIDELVEANYLVKRLKNYGGKMQVLMNEGNKSNYEMKPNFAEITKEILRPFNLLSYFEKDNSEPKQALVFNATVLNDDFSKPQDYQQHLQRYLFEMRRVFKESYQPSETELSFENEEIYQPFENSIWGVAQEGISNIVYHTDNKTTNDFFSQGYIGRIKKNYLHMYMIALHQRYALLHLSVRAARIPRKLSVLIESAEAYEDVNKLREEIAYFDLRSAFLNISHITHQNKLYQTIYHALRLGELHNKLQSEVEAVSSLLDIRKSVIEQEIDRERNERLRKNDNFYVIATTIFVVISTLGSLWGLYKDFWTESTRDNAFWTSFLMIILLGGIGMFYKLYTGDKEKQ